MNRLKNGINGITLVALVVTIIVLLILAGVAISLSIGNNGIFTRADNAVNTWKRAEKNETDEISKFTNTYDKILNSLALNDTYENVGDNGSDFEEDSRKILTEITGEETDNTQAKDKNGNKVLIPAGFKPINPNDDVTDGVVIQDETAGDETSKGNQYVWIPVSHVNGEKINTIKDNQGKEHTIELARYTFNSDGTVATKIVDGSKIDGMYIEETEEEHTASGYSNTIAKDIDKFKEKVRENGGYYIARYEAGSPTATSDITGAQIFEPVFQENKITYTWIKQSTAATLVRNLYNNKNQKYTSDLLNSYAWDTAIIYIQEFSGDTTYSVKGRLQTTLARTGQSTDGTNKDVRCNIYDMAGNGFEWTTETCDNTSCYTVRGGSYRSGQAYTMTRLNEKDYAITYYTFRRNFILNFVGFY